ncbi:MAG: hypothetical protein MJE68_08095, partial [Proteobacteria bacterium]|nr:hypothetical protein [Pseudomonadota bacterium]
MTDLTRRSPEIFNIRHTERGVQTRNTKRKGGNLHCIMAFKKLEAGPSEFFVNVGQPLDEQDSSQQNPEEAELQVPESEIEDLNSSDSDYPVETSERNRIIDVQEEVTQTSLVDAGKQMVEAWRNARVTQGGKKSSDGIRIPTEDLEGIEGVDVGQVAQDGADDDSDPLDSTLTEETPPTLAAEIEQSSLPDERDDPLLISSNVPVIQASSPPPPLNVDSTSPTMVRKYGTYRKKRSSLSPNKTRPLSSSSDEDSSQSPSVKKRSRNSANSKGKQIDSDNNNNTANLEVENSAGAGIQRRGTFTKEVPTIRVERTRPLSTTSNSSDQDDSARNGSAVEAVDFDDSPTESGLKLKRSGTFTKSPAPVLDQAPPYTNDGTCTTNELAIPVDSSSPGSSNLRRSGTFTKEKPDVIVIKTRVSSTSSASASDKEMLSDAEME